MRENRTVQSEMSLQVDCSDEEKIFWAFLTLYWQFDKLSAIVAGK